MNGYAGPLGALVCALLLAGCAASYSPPPERRAADRCPINEVWVCNQRSPSRLPQPADDTSICRCERPELIR